MTRVLLVCVIAFWMVVGGALLGVLISYVRRKR